MEWFTQGLRGIAVGRQVIYNDTTIWRIVNQKHSLTAQSKYISNKSEGEALKTMQTIYT